MEATGANALFRDEDVLSSQIEGTALSRPGLLPGAVGGLSRSSVLIIGLCLLLLVEWLVFGWIVWTTKWGGMLPSDLARSRDRMFRVSLAAEKYWQTGDPGQVQRDLADIPRSELARVTANMLRETTDTNAKLHLTALATLMQVETAEPLLTGALFSQSGVLFGIVVSTVPLLAALAVLVLPAVRRTVRVVTHGAAAVTEEEAAAIAVAEAEGGGGGEVLEELVAEVPTEANLEVNPEAKPEEAPQSDESEEQADPGLGDLASLFEEEDTSIAALEAFCKGMTDVNVDDLHKRGREIVDKLRAFNSQR